MTYVWDPTFQHLTFKKQEQGRSGANIFPSLWAFEILQKCFESLILTQRLQKMHCNLMRFSSKTYNIAKVIHIGNNAQE